MILRKVLILCGWQLMSVRTRPWQHAAMVPVLAEVGPGFDRNPLLRR
jgi:hypothetical protein